MTELSYLHLSADGVPVGVAARTTLRIWGQDAERFLQGILSQDVARFSSTSALACCVLNVKGKLQWEAVAWRLEEGTFYLNTPTDGALDLVAELKRHVIMDDVELALDELQTALLFAVDTDIEARRLVAVSGERQEQPIALEPSMTRALREAGLLVLRVTHPAPGLLLVGAAEQLDRALAPLYRASAVEWDLYRVMTASPAWLHEIHSGAFPPECGFVAAVSYEKGCYMGQEPLARIHARSQVNWVLVRVRVESDRGLAAGLGRCPIALRSAERENAGRLTTLATTPDGQLGLAIVRREFAVPGTALLRAAADPDGSQSPEFRVTVLSAPLGDDQGLAPRQDS